MTKLSWLQHRRIKKTFKKIAGRDQLIDFSEWKKVLNNKYDLLSRSSFDLIDTDNSGYVDEAEFLAFGETLYADNPAETLGLLFDIYDVNKDGKIDKDELRQVLKTALSEQSIRLEEHTVDDLTEVLLQHIKPNQKTINRENFINASLNFPSIEQHLNNFSEDWMAAGQRIKSTRYAAASIMKRLKRIIYDNWSTYIWGIGYLTLNVILFKHAMQLYASQGAPLAVQIARGGGACLNLNSAVILLPMCRALVSSIQATIVGNLLPLKNPIYIHKMIGYLIALFTLVHVIAHLTNYQLTQMPIINEVFYTRIGITGVIATVTLAIIIGASIYLKSLNHQMFSIVHATFAIYLIAILYHSHIFWVWLTLPAILLLFDSLIRIFCKTKKLKITKLTGLANEVTLVTLKKSKWLDFKPGDFLWLCIPEISEYQWHPFTISAAPESKRFNIHIKNSGDWTGHLNNISRKKHPKNKTWAAKIDGPYHSPSSHIEKSKIAVLISAGIGVTPFVSVMHSLLLQKDTPKQHKTLYFHWINRSHKSYNWFSDMLRKAENGHTKINLYLHLTSLNNDLTNLALQMAFHAYRQKKGVDPITGLKVNTSAGRPNWDQNFRDIVDRHPREKVDIFYCGPKKLGHDVKKMSRKYGFTFRNKKF